jgi:hypothetical protein
LHWVLGGIISVSIDTNIGTGIAVGDVYPYQADAKSQLGERFKKSLRDKIH